MEDHGAVEATRAASGVVVGRARVDHDRLVQLAARARAARSKSCCLRVARRVVAVVVEPGLADARPPLVPQQLARARRAVAPPRPRLVRMDAERGEDAVVLARRSRARRATSRSRCRRRRRGRRRPRARARATSAGSSQRVEVRVRVDHSPARPAELLVDDRPGRASEERPRLARASGPAGSSLGSQRPTHLS